MHGYQHRHFPGILCCLLAWIIGTEATAQTVIDFRDSVSFQRLPRTDTIDNDYLTVTPYPDSTDLDLDCDSVADVRLKCYKTPLPNLPQAHHIVIRPMAGSGVQILADGAKPRTFRRDTALVVDSLSGWSTLPEYEILYFNVLSGASWAGVAGTDSVTVTDRCVVFRKEESGTFRYGWIAYDGIPWPARLSVRETAWSGSGCTTVGTEDLNALPKAIVLPNPAQGSWILEPPPAAALALLIDQRGVEVSRYALHPGTNLLHGEDLPAGTYILILQGEDGRQIAEPHKLVLLPH